MLSMSFKAATKSPTEKPNDIVYYEKGNRYEIDSHSVTHEAVTLVLKHLKCKHRCHMDDRVSKRN